jgi:stage II sporulation protein AA (anti-sigma F factor antagonist)
MEIENGGNMGKQYQLEGRKLTVYMPKELDHHVAQPLCAKLDTLIETYGVRELEFDFSDTEFMDSSGIGVLIGRSKTMAFSQGKVSARGMGLRVKRIFEAAGLQKMIQVWED